LNSAQADAKALASRRIDEHLAVIGNLRESRGAIADIARVIAEALRAGGKVLAFGNGGSATDAEHFVGELVGRYYLEQGHSRPLRSPRIRQASQRSPTTTSSAGCSSVR